MQFYTNLVYAKTIIFLQGGLSLQPLFPAGLAYSIPARISPRAYRVNHCDFGDRPRGDIEHCGEFLRNHFPVTEKKQLAVIPTLADNH